MRLLALLMPALTLATTLALAACGPAPAPRVTPELVTAAQRDEPGASAANLEHGRTVYTNRCASCHALPRPADYDPPTWRHWVRVMTPKARLGETDAATVLSYVIAVRRAQEPTPAN